MRWTPPATSGCGSSSRAASTTRRSRASRPRAPRSTPTAWVPRCCAGRTTSPPTWSASTAARWPRRAGSRTRTRVWSSSTSSAGRGDAAPAGASSRSGRPGKGSAVKGGNTAVRRPKTTVRRGWVPCRGVCASPRGGKEDPQAFSGLLANIQPFGATRPAGRAHVRLVVAHQSPMLAEALGRLLNALGLTVVATTCDPDALVSQLAGGTADVLVLDAGFHPIGGPLATLERIRAAAPAVRVVVVADEVDEALSVAARDGDLDGVVLASARGAELVAAVTQVGAGHAVFPAGWARQVRQSAQSSPVAQLSPRQREVLELIALGMDNDQIATRLYISRNTGKSPVRTFCRRLGVHTRGGAARVLAGVGNGSRGAPAGPGAPPPRARAGRRAL